MIAFDGFTGFTPIQYRVIQELMRLAGQVIITITIDIKENPYILDGEQKLFHLSKKTVADLRRLAKEAGTEMLEDVVCGQIKKEGPAGAGETVKPQRREMPAEASGVIPRFTGNPELAHLEQHLFRYPVVPYEKEPERIRLTECSTPKEEVRQTCIEIQRLL